MFTHERATWVVGGLLLAAAVAGQPRELMEPGVASSVETYGTASLVIQAVSAIGISPLSSSTTYDTDNLDVRFSTGGSGDFGASVVLPAGALIDHIELDGCDESATKELFAFLWICDAGGQCGDYGYNTLLSGAPGCGLFSSPTGTHTVDNRNNTYAVRITANAGDSTIRFRGVRIFYRLQVSPAPATASFSDVPTDHLFFQFIEALAAAGITAGYPDGRFGVEDPVTRGQMAVFFAKALGLHWAP